MGVLLLILTDFRKLLLARADLRLMVFDGQTPANCQDLIELMRREIQDFKKTISGDRYLFAYWPTKSNSAGFEFSPYIA